jgi:hypothetical protein
MGLLLAAFLSCQDAPSVGMPRTLTDVVLPGPELEAVPLDDPRAPLVLRIASAAPHGSAHRYTFVWYGLEPGSYDLRDRLRRKDGKPLEGVPRIPVNVIPAYPRAERRTVGEIALSPLGRLGLYRVLLGIGGAVWVLGLVALLLGRRRRRRIVEAPVAPETAADRLRPLVEQARRGGLSLDEQASLERLLISYWRERAGLAGLEPAEALAKLRTLEPAGTLLCAIERKLHHPTTTEDLDLAALLAPYGREGAP